MRTIFVLGTTVVWMLLIAVSTPALYRSALGQSGNLNFPAGSFPAKQPTAPPGLPPVIWPRVNPYSPEKAHLGWLLFFDPRLSADQGVSCATCHVPTKAFTDGKVVSRGVGGRQGTRNAPTIINGAYNKEHLWDGRANTFERQALVAMLDPAELGMTEAALLAAIRSIPGYVPFFQKAFGSKEMSLYHLVLALATFQRTVLSGSSPYDHFVAGDTTALTEQQQSGMKLFFGKAQCGTCHPAPLFTTGEFTNIGHGMERANPDMGRFVITLKGVHRGAFKIPSLREVANTAPYMHDGSVQTLAEVVMIYVRGGLANPWLDKRMFPLHLNPREVADIVEFLKALSGEGWKHIKPPPSLPKGL